MCVEGETNKYHRNEEREKIRQMVWSVQVRDCDSDRNYEDTKRYKQTQKLKKKKKVKKIKKKKR